MSDQQQDLCDTVVILVSHLCDGTLREDQHCQLEGILLESAEARAIYRSFMSLHLALRDQYSVEGDLPAVLPLHRGSELPEVGLESPRDSKASSNNFSSPALAFQGGTLSFNGILSLSCVWALLLALAVGMGSAVTAMVLSSAVANRNLAPEGTSPQVSPRGTDQITSVNEFEKPSARPPLGSSDSTPGAVSWQFRSNEVKPSGLPVTTDLALWLSADREVYANRGHDPPRDGEPVLAWVDSERGICASQRRLTARPAWIETAIAVGSYEYRPALRFSGRQGLHVDALTAVFRGEDRPATIFAVVQFAYYDEPDRQTLLGLGRTDDNATLYEFATTSPRDHPRAPDSFFCGRRDAALHEKYGISDAHSVRRDQLVVLSAVDTGRLVSMYVSGRPLFEKQDVDVGSLDYDHAMLGAIPYGGVPGAWLRGDLAEIIVFSRSLAQVEHEQLQQYLLEKYGRADTHSN